MQLNTWSNPSSHLEIYVHISFNSLYCATKKTPTTLPYLFRKWFPVRKMLKITKNFLKGTLWFWIKGGGERIKFSPALKFSIRAMCDQNQGNLSDIIRHFSASCVKLKLNPKYFVTCKCHKINKTFLLRIFFFVCLFFKDIS